MSTVLAHRRHAIRTGLGGILIIALIAIAAGTLYGAQLAGWFGVTVPGSVTPNPGQNTNPPGTVDVNIPVKLTVMDYFGSAAVASATVTPYVNGVAGVALTSDSNGQATTADPYWSNTVLDVKVVKGVDVAFYKVTVPKMTSQGATGAATNGPIRLNFFASPTSANTVLSVKIGSTQQTNSSYYGATVSGKTGTFSVTVDIGTDNKGFIASYDPINQQDLKAYVVVYTYSTYASNYALISLTGGTASPVRGTTGYYIMEVPLSTFQGIGNVATGITKYKPGNTYLLPGTFTATWNFDFTGLGSAATYTNLTVTLRTQSDLNYFEQTGSWGGNSLGAGTFLLGIQG